MSLPSFQCLFSGRGGFMVQSWVSVAGIAIDLVGFLLLLREWWLAFFHETAMLDLQQRRAFEQSMRHHQRAAANEQMRGHLDTFARMQDEMAERNVRGRHTATLRSRKQAFVLATALIVIGSLLQLAGQIPAELFSALTGLG
jgi:ferric-dicitrate binding protein FerR (iron transport regulator)